MAPDTRLFVRNGVGSYDRVRKHQVGPEHVAYWDEVFEAWVPANGNTREAVAAILGDGWAWDDYYMAFFANKAEKPVTVEQDLLLRLPEGLTGGEVRERISDVYDEVFLRAGLFNETSTQEHPGRVNMKPSEVHVLLPKPLDMTPWYARTEWDGMSREVFEATAERLAVAMRTKGEAPGTDEEFYQTVVAAWRLEAQSDEWQPAQLEMDPAGFVLPGVSVTAEFLEESGSAGFQRLLEEVMRAWACHLFRAVIQPPHFAAMSTVFWDTWNGLHDAQNRGHPLPWDDKEVSERKLKVLREKRRG